MNVIKNQTNEKNCMICLVRDMDDLRKVIRVLGNQFSPAISPEDGIFTDLIQNFPQDRQLMLVVEKDRCIIGGALGFGSTLRIVALIPEVRGKGLGRRLIQTYEIMAIKREIQTISLGSLDEAKDFYRKMGYPGKSSMHKDLPLPGPVRDYRLQKLLFMVGDLEIGQIITLNETGKVPALF